ncbi:MAG: MFS transporter [Candidatus Nitrosocosmicus sp.]
MTDKSNNNFWVLLVILSCIAVVIEYAETMLFPAIPNIIDDFKIDYSTSSWILSGYLITAAVMAPIAGKLSDTYGKKKILLIIMSIFIISISAAGFSMNASFLIACRIIQGIGLSMFIISLSILQSEVPKEKYALANGILASLYFSGSSLGLIAGGSIIHITDWTVTFFSLIPLLGILYIVIIKFLKVNEIKQRPIDIKLSDLNFHHHNTDNNPNNIEQDTNPFSLSKRRKIDIKGAFILALGITFLLLALSYLDTGDSSGSGITFSSISVFSAFLTISLTFIIAFVKVEKKSTDPIIDLKFISNGSIFPLLIIFLIMGFTMFMVYQTIPILVRAPIPVGFDGTTLTSSIVLLPFTIIFLALSPFVSKVISKFGNLRPLIFASIVSLIGFVSIYIFHANEFHVGINLGIISTGLALINTIAMNIILLLTPKQFGGVVVGIVQVFTFTGMALGPVISGLYMQNFQRTIGRQSNRIDTID